MSVMYRVMYRIVYADGRTTEWSQLTSYTGGARPYTTLAAAKGVCTREERQRRRSNGVTYEFRIETACVSDWEEYEQ